MAAKLALSSSSSSSSSLTTKFSLPSKSPSSPRPSLPFHSTPKSKVHHFKIHAKIGGGEEELKKGDKKFITKEQEPEQYWQTAGEREGENPMKTPLPYIIIFGMSTPFIILAIAFANGWIKAPLIR